MNVRTRMDRQTLLNQIAACLATLLLVASASGCGKQSGGAELGGGIPVSGGTAFFGSQCDYGTYRDPSPKTLSLNECPVDLGELVLLESLRPIMIKADCHDKTLAVRGMGASCTGSNCDSLWNTLPDGTFSVTVDGGYAKLSDDGSGHENCVTQLAADLFGQMECRPGERDKVDVRLQANWRMGASVPRPSPSVSVSASPSPRPSSSTSPRPSTRPTVSWVSNLTAAAAIAAGNTCQLPASCFLYSRATIHQCQ